MGIIIALTVIVLWLMHLFYTLLYQAVDPGQFGFWLHIVLQSWLSTGLFITAHDAMHGTVGRSKQLNTVVGYASTLLYAGMNYSRLHRNHILHHQYPATEKDPDYNAGNQQFFVWWFRFMTKYLTIWQIVIMAVIFNILLLWFNEWQLILFWVIPLFLSTFQLFYFGTYLPHRMPHTSQMGEHRSRTLPKNHLYAFLSCYFFGYHAEHHALPHTPWWKLYQTK